MFYDKRKGYSKKRLSIVDGWEPPNEQKILEEIKGVLATHPQLKNGKQTTNNKRQKLRQKFCTETFLVVFFL